MKQTTFSGTPLRQFKNAKNFIIARKGKEDSGASRTVVPGTKFQGGTRNPLRIEGPEYTQSQKTHREEKRPPREQKYEDTPSGLQDDVSTNPSHKKSERLTIGAYAKKMRGEEKGRTRGE